MTGKDVGTRSCGAGGCEEAGWTVLMMSTCFCNSRSLCFDMNNSVTTQFKINKLISLELLLLLEKSKFHIHIDKVSDNVFLA